MLATGGSQMLGSAIGNHVLTKVLGEGAMGTVYYAEHAHPPPASTSFCGRN